MVVDAELPAPTPTEVTPIAAWPPFRLTENEQPAATLPNAAAGAGLMVGAKTAGPSNIGKLQPDERDPGRRVRPSACRLASLERLPVSHYDTASSRSTCGSPSPRSGGGTQVRRRRWQPQDEAHRRAYGDTPQPTTGHQEPRLASA